MAKKDSLAALKSKTAKARMGMLADGKADSGDRQHLNTRLPKSMIKQIKIYCATNELSIQDFMTEAVTDRLKK